MSVSIVQPRTSWPNNHIYNNILTGDTCFHYEGAQIRWLEHVLFCCPNLMRDRLGKIVAHFRRQGLWRVREFLFECPSTSDSREWQCKIQIFVMNFFKHLWYKFFRFLSFKSFPCNLSFFWSHQCYNEILSMPFPFQTTEKHDANYWTMLYLVATRHVRWQRKSDSR